MGNQIIKQPNGKYCIFSSIIDSVIYYDMTPEEIIDMRVEESRKEITKAVNKIVRNLNKGRRPYYEFTKTYEEMMEWIKEVHGEKPVQELRALIESSDAGPKPKSKLVCAGCGKIIEADDNCWSRVNSDDWYHQGCVEAAS